MHGVFISSEIYQLRIGPLWALIEDLRLFVIQLACHTMAGSKMCALLKAIPGQSLHRCPEVHVYVKFACACPGFRLGKSGHSIFIAFFYMCLRLFHRTFGLKVSRM